MLGGDLLQFAQDMVGDVLGIANVKGSELACAEVEIENGVIVFIAGTGYVSGVILRGENTISIGYLIAELTAVCPS